MNAKRKIFRFVALGVLLPQILYAGDVGSNALVVHRHELGRVHLHRMSLSEFECGAANSTRYGHRSSASRAGIDQGATVLAVVVCAPVNGASDSSTVRALRSIDVTAKISFAIDTVEEPAAVALPPHDSGAQHFETTNAFHAILERNHAILI